MTIDQNVEMLACFDEAGNQILPHSRTEVHTTPLQFWHGVVNIWVINSLGQILVSKRSVLNEGNPGKWQTYVGGHVKDGDSFDETAGRELGEELGLSQDNGQLTFFNKDKSELRKHITHMYAFLWDGKTTDVNKSDGEIEEVKWISFDEYIADKNDNPDNWCNSINLERYDKILQTQNNK